jgi:hypothetical protein
MESWLASGMSFLLEKLRILSLRVTDKDSQGDYEAGDVVFHSPYSVHAAAINEDPRGRVRISTDLRFVDKAKPYDQRWIIPAFDKEDRTVARTIKLSQ